MKTALKIWLPGPLLGSLSLALVWASTYWIAWHLFPDIWSDARVGGVGGMHFRLGYALVMQLGFGALFGLLTVLVWRRRSRSLAIFAGTLGAAVFAYQTWISTSGLLFHSPDSLVVAWNYHDLLLYSPVILWSLGLVFFGVCARPPKR